MPVVRAGCGSPGVLSRQYVGDQCWTAETTELGSVEGQWVVQQEGEDFWRVHVLITGTPTVHHTRPHVPHYHCVFAARAFPSQASRRLRLCSKGNQSLPLQPLQRLG